MELLLTLERVSGLLRYSLKDRAIIIEMQERKEME
jgi:hypothetical protein